MEKRFTKNENGKVLCNFEKCICDCENCNHYKKAMIKMAAYEDLGTPEEFARLLKIYQETDIMNI